MTRILTIFAVVLTFSAPARAAPYPVAADPFVNDYADVLAPAKEERLRSDLRNLKDETGVEMTVLTIGARDDFDATPSVEAFATGLFNAWGIGGAGRNDGILVLVAARDREMRLELGAAYNQGYDVLAEDIVARFFLPDFREGDLGRGIVTGSAETMARIARRHAADLPAEALPKVGRGLPHWLPFSVVAALVAFAAFRRRQGDWSYRLRRCPSCGRMGLAHTREITSPATVDGDGSGMVRIACRHCDFREERDIRIAHRGEEHASGGGFGGGESSGGGATGRW